MANTVIQLKYSNSTATPSSLTTGEVAYSNNSNKLFVGLSSGAIVAVGGSYYTGLVDAATDANTVSTIVKRDASGIFSATAVKASLFGNANTAAVWQTARTIGVSGDANGTVSIDGSANANIPLTLGSTGVSAGTYGGATQVPTFVVDSKGRITSAANVALSTTFNFAGNTGTGTTSTGGTLTIVGTNGGGITTTFTDATDTFGVAVDATVVRTSGAQSIAGDLSVTGNLIINGTTTTVNTSTVTTSDSLIKLANNNTAGDTVDIGFYGTYNATGQKYAGLVRQAGSNFFLFKDLTTDPTANTLAAGSLTVANTATLRANITGGTVSGLASAIAVGDGGTGATTFTGGGILIGNGTGAVSSLANSTYTLTGGLSAANTISALTVDAYGRVTAATGVAIAIGAGQITSGTLPIARGGTNQTTFTAGQRLVYDGASLASQANTSTTVTGALSAANTITSLTYNTYGELTAFTGAAIAIDTAQITSGTIADARLPTKGTAGTYANAAYVPVITTDAYGRVTAVTNTAIAIDTSQITSGILGVVRGGTGSSSYTANGVIFGGLTSTSPLLSVASSTEGHVLQINTSGIPSFAMLNGGTF
jgi:hypothetical protein